MAAFAIQPHGRWQEWVADEKGYFRDEGLDYEFNMRRLDTYGVSPSPAATARTAEISDVLSGAFESYEAGKGRKGVDVGPEVGVSYEVAVQH
jgi:hypothetical protein